jgi:hypothetical protein
LLIYSGKQEEVKSKKQKMMKVEKMPPLNSNPSNAYLALKSEFESQHAIGAITLQGIHSHDAK